MNRSRTYFSVFLGIIILSASYYFSQTFFFGRKDAPPVSVSKILSSGNTPKFAESGTGSSAGTVNVTKTVVDDISGEFYAKVQGLDAQQKDDLFAQIKAGNVAGLDLENVDPDQIAQKLTPDLIGVRAEISDDEIQSDPKNDMVSYKKRYLLAVTDVQLAEQHIAVRDEETR